MRNGLAKSSAIGVQTLQSRSRNTDLRTVFEIFTERVPSYPVASFEAPLTSIEGSLKLHIPHVRSQNRSISLRVEVYESSTK